MLRARNETVAETEDASREELIRVKAAVEASGDIAYDWDLVADTITWSGGTSPVSPFLGPAKVTAGAEFLRRIRPDDVLARRRALAGHLENGDPFDCEYRLGGDPAASDHEEPGGIWVHERGSAQVAPGGRAVRLVGTLRVVTARKRNEARLRYEAAHDVLTGLYNRSRLLQALDDVMIYNRRYGRRGFYLTVGIDRLTIINNAFGYDAGDAVLFDLSQRLEMRPRIGDVLGRVGGDCFGVVVGEGEAEDIELVADRILEQMRATPVETPHGPVFVTASIGATCFGDDDLAPQDVIAKAEVALREAKRAGRDRFFTYSETDFLRQGHRQYAAIAERVQTALKSDRLVFAYQPVIVSAGGEVAHYECLLRMIDDDGKIVAAGAFIPVIEEMGLVRQVDRRVLEMAAAELVRNPDVCLAINVSGLTACDGSWLSRLVEICAAHPDLAQRLIVEITETVALRDIDESARFVNAVRGLGCRVALDDFGAGYTSFRNLRALTVDVVKIDGSFVRDVALSKDNQLFIKSLVGLARGFGLRTVAECVESGEDARTLQDHGVDYMQGYFYGRPDLNRPWSATAALGELPRGPGAGFGHAPA